MPLAIETKGLTKRYKHRTAVDGLELAVEQGTFLALLGLNGAGKTTTVKMLCGLLTPTEGDALVLGNSICRSPAAVKQLINVAPQETAVAPNLTVRENLELVARLYGANKKTARRKAEAYMARLGLAERGKDKAKRLSGGLARRLSIGMALITEPKVLFLDEPTLGLDVRARRDLWKLIEELAGQVSIVLTTHYLEEAEALSDKVAVMHEGKLRAFGSAEELLAQTGAANFEDAYLALTDAQTPAQTGAKQPGEARA